MLFRSENDLGTYEDREKEVAWLSKINIDTPYGGEVTVPGSSYNELNHAVEEMFQLHLSYLNLRWNDQVIKRWKDTKYTGTDSLYKNSTEYSYIKNHLGYRFILKNLRYHENNSTLNLNLNVNNVGFGNLLKSKNAYIVFQNEEHTYTFKFENVDINNLIFEIDKKNISRGTYKVYFVLADDFTESGTRSIRLGNQDIWDETIKGNIIFNSFNIE